MVPHVQGLVKTTSSEAIDKVENRVEMFTLDEMMQVFYFSILHGATLWQYSIDTNKNLPDDFNKGLDGIRARVTTALELQEVLKSRALMVGLFEEYINPTTNSTSLTEVKEVNKDNTNSESVK